MHALSPEFVGTAVTCALTLLLAAFHAGAWRERVDATKHGLALELRNFRDTTTQNFARIELRLDSIDRQLAAMQDQRAKRERWQGAVDTTLEGHEARLDRLQQAEAT